MDRSQRVETVVEHEVPELIGESPAWRTLVESLPRVAASGLPVLLLGETGSGKEVVSRALHALSARRRQPFVAQNCGATPDTLIESELFGHARGAFTGAIGDRTGLFEAAEGGTLLLDEIGDASPLLQMKLLRVLQEGEARRVGDSRARRVDVRVIAATHRPLERAVASGTFRADLFFRLAAVRVRLPSLRERGRDVLLLARHFLARAAARVGGPVPELAPDLQERLLRHAWPGNVRELATVMERAAILGDGRGLEVAKALGVGGLSSPAAPVREQRGAPPANSGVEFATLDTAMRRHIEAALSRTKGRVEGPTGA
ncbi:MAG TPA: sigma-54 dependent transcriptional regulator, partial [Gemmatimonadales bacterium]|nr:sigma-54 dependent transcriptional regulator [Gemmatimonadales bacterium]